MTNRLIEIRVHPGLRSRPNGDTVEIMAGAVDVVDGSLIVKTKTKDGLVVSSVFAPGEWRTVWCKGLVDAVPA
jgi:hypothetical protein